MKRRIVLLGPPASGKGTLADRLQRDHELPTVSPGSLLRAEKAAGTELGKRADDQTSKGRLVDDGTINAIVKSWIERQLGDGFVFDGYPRTVGQAVALGDVLKERNLPLDVAILLDADEQTLIDRVNKRAICDRCGNIVSVGFHVATFETACPRCGGKLERRRDDTVETLRLRMEEYQAKTAPLIEYYAQRKLLARVDAAKPAEDVFQEAMRYLA